jgi:cation:H+ antiporter
LTVLGFGIGLALTLASSELFARGLTRLGTKLGLSEGLIGLLAALGADSPELSAAVVALLAGAGSVGVGVIVGSNLFNLAALLGLSAILAGGIAIRRGPLLLDASVGLLITIVAAAMIAGFFPPALAAAGVFPIAVVYVLILSSSHRRLGRLAVVLAAAPHGFGEIAYEVATSRGYRCRSSRSRWPAWSGEVS